MLYLYARRGRGTWWALAMPFYTLAVGFILTPLGVVWYAKMAAGARNWGLTPAEPPRPGAGRGCAAGERGVMRWVIRTAGILAAIAALVLCTGLAFTDFLPFAARTCPPARAPGRAAGGTSWWTATSRGAA